MYNYARMGVDARSITEQQYRNCVLRFKHLHNAQAVFAKIGHVPAGTTAVEMRIFAGLKKLKTLLDTAPALVITAQLNAVEGMLKEYEEWLDQSESTVTPFDLRQYIRRNELGREDLIEYARYLSLRRQNTTDGRGKLELLLSELHKTLGHAEREMLLSELFPEATISPAALQVLEQIKLLAARVDELATLADLVDSDIVNVARRLKADLGTSLWTSEAIAVVSEFNARLGEELRRLFVAERHFVIESCRRLRSLGISYIAKANESGALNVEQAARLAERSEELLEQNYNTNFQKLQQLAKVGTWLRQALRTLEPQPATTAELKRLAVARPKPERESSIDPISFTLDYADYKVVEEQLVRRVEELKSILEQRRRLSGMEVVQLKNSVLLLTEWEIASVMSVREMVDKSKRMPYELIRRGIGLVAELQETTAVLAGNPGEIPQRTIRNLSYLLEQSKQVQGELETISRACRRAQQIELALNLHCTRNKLQDCSQRAQQALRSLGYEV
ncbi:MAG: hypothetical protein NZ558_10575 [Blastocatellia bacterium]|nr:hypothetical protein [Blastocatellia bacterium]